MQPALTISSVGGSSDELRSLQTWLLAEDELRGFVTSLEQPPHPERLGPTLEALQILANPAAAALAASLVAWLKHRVGSVHLVVKDGTGSQIELKSGHVRNLDAAAIAELTDRLTRLAGASDTPAGPEDVSGHVSGRSGTGQGPEARGSAPGEAVYD